MKQWLVSGVQFKFLYVHCRRAVHDHRRIFHCNDCNGEFGSSNDFNAATILTDCTWSSPSAPLVEFAAMGTQGGDVDKDFCFTLGNHHECASQVLLVQLFGLFPQKGLERCKCLASQAQGVAAVARCEFAQLKAHGLNVVLAGLARWLKVNDHRAAFSKSGREFSAILSSHDSSTGSATMRQPPCESLCFITGYLNRTKKVAVNCHVISLPFWLKICCRSDRCVTKAFDGIEVPYTFMEVDQLIEPKSGS